MDNNIFQTRNNGQLQNNRILCSPDKIMDLCSGNMDKLRCQDDLGVLKSVGSDYDRLVLALQCPLPNEQDFALKVCTLLSNKTKYFLKLNKAPKLLDGLLGHAGIFSDCLSRCLLEEAYTEDRGLNPKHFWDEYVQNTEIRKLLCESFVRKEQIIASLHNVHPEMADSHGYCAGEINVNLRRKKSQLEERKNVDAKLSRLQICCSLCPCQNDFMPTDNISYPHLANENQQILEKTGKRILLVANILRNLSFEDYNALLMASEDSVIRFLLIAANCSWKELPQLSYDTMGNVSKYVILKEPSADPLSSMLIDIILNGLFSNDRFQVIRSMEILKGLASTERNKIRISQHFRENVYIRLVELITVKDIMLLTYSLECLLAMTNMGKIACNDLMDVCGSLTTIVSLLTVDAQTYRPEGCISMHLVETTTISDDDFFPEKTEQHCEDLTSGEAFKGSLNLINSPVPVSEKLMKNNKARITPISKSTSNRCSAVRKPTAKTTSCTKKNQTEVAVAEVEDSSSLKSNASLLSTESREDKSDTRTSFLGIFRNGQVMTTKCGEMRKIDGRNKGTKRNTDLLENELSEMLPLTAVPKKICNRLPDRELTELVGNSFHYWDTDTDIPKKWITVKRKAKIVGNSFSGPTPNITDGRSSSRKVIHTRKHDRKMFEIPLEISPSQNVQKINCLTRNSLQRDNLVKSKSGSYLQNSNYTGAHQYHDSLQSQISDGSILPSQNLHRLPSFKSLQNFGCVQKPSSQHTPIVQSIVPQYEKAKMNVSVIPKRAAVRGGCSKRYRNVRQKNDGFNGYNYLCEWKGCNIRFLKPNHLYLHAVTYHCPDGVAGITCKWGSNVCDLKIRKRFSMMTHLHDKHCNGIALETALNYRLNNIIPPPVGEQRSWLAQDTAFTTMRELSKLYYKNPDELKDENEGLVTHSLRLTAALIIHNIVKFSMTGRKMCHRYESRFSDIAASNLATSKIMTHILYDMNQYNNTAKEYILWHCPN